MRVDDFFGTSDLHVENSYSKKRVRRLIEGLPDSNGVIVAGDLGIVAMKFRELWGYGLEVLCDKYNTVVYVPGDHEYFLSSKRHVDLILDGKNIEGLHILNNSSVKISGCRIFGTTLWHYGVPNRCSISRYLFSGYSRIKDKKDKGRDWYFDSMMHLTEFINEVRASGEKSVVVTHHVPYTPALAFREKYPLITGVMNAFGYYDQFSAHSMNGGREGFMGYGIEKLIPDNMKWVFGHFHLPYHDNRFLSNPVGYNNLRKDLGAEYNFIRI